MNHFEVYFFAEQECMHIYRALLQKCKKKKWKKEKLDVYKNAWMHQKNVLKW